MTSEDPATSAGVSNGGSSTLETPPKTSKSPKPTKGAAINVPELSVADLHHFVKLGLQKLKRGDYYTEFNLDEACHRKLAAMEALPSKSERDHVFNSFVRAVATDIVIHEGIATKKKAARKAYEKHLQMLRSKWFKLITGTTLPSATAASDASATSPTTPTTDQHAPTANVSANVITPGATNGATNGTTNGTTNASNGANGNSNAETDITQRSPQPKPTKTKKKLKKKKSIVSTTTATSTTATATATTAIPLKKRKAMEMSSESSDANGTRAADDTATSDTPQRPSSKPRLDPHSPSSDTATNAAETNETKAPVKDKRNQRMMARKAKWDKERDAILKTVPQDYKERFGQIGFAKWNKETLPALAKDPFQAPPGQVRETWLQMHQKTSQSNRLDHMTVLVYWYGSWEQPQYSFVKRNVFFPYDEAVKKGLNRISPRLQKKIDAGKPLSPKDQYFMDGLEEMEADLEKKPEERRGFTEKTWLEEYEEGLEGDEGMEDLADDIDHDDSDDDDEEDEAIAAAVADNVVSTKSSAKTKKLKKMEKTTAKTKQGKTRNKKAKAKTKAEASNGDDGKIDAPTTKAPKSDSPIGKGEAKSTKSETADVGSAANALDATMDADMGGLDDTDESDSGDYNYEDDLDDYDHGDSDHADDDYEDPEESKSKKKAKSKSAAKSSTSTKSKGKIPKPKAKGDAGKAPLAKKKKSKKTAGESTSRVDMEHRAEQRAFEKCEAKYLKYIKTWQQSKDEDEIDKILAFLFDKVDEFTAPFILAYEIAHLLKACKKRRPSPIRKSIFEKLRGIYRSKFDKLPTGFKAKKREANNEVADDSAGQSSKARTTPYPEIAPSRKAKESVAPQPPSATPSLSSSSSSLSVPKRTPDNNTSTSKISSSSSSTPAANGKAVTGTIPKTPSSIPKPTKSLSNGKAATPSSNASSNKSDRPEKKRFSLGSLWRPSSDDKLSSSKKDAQRNSSSSLSAIETAVAKSLPKWMTAPSKVQPPSHDTRSLALEFMQQAVDALPQTKTSFNRTSVALEIENVISATYPITGFEWETRYWEIVDAFIALVTEFGSGSGGSNAGDYDKSVHVRLLKGLFATPVEVIKAVSKELPYTVMVRTPTL